MPTKEELEGPLTARLGAVENTLSEYKGSIKLGWAIIVIAGAAFLTSIGCFVWMLFDARAMSLVHTEKFGNHEKEIGSVKTYLGEKLTDIKNSQTEKLTDLKSQHTADNARLEKCIEKMEERLTKRMSDGQKTAYYGQTLTHYHEHEGKVTRVAKDSLWLEYVDNADGKTKEWNYQIDPAARVIIKGQTGKVADIKPGMYVLILHNNGERVQLIETIEPPKADQLLFKTMPK
jgi:hypothetical protein